MWGTSSSPAGLPVLMMLGVRSHVHAFTRLKQSWGVGKTAHLVQCTYTKATLSGLQITLLPHTPCSFKECDFSHTTILQTISSGLQIWKLVESEKLLISKWWCEWSLTIIKCKTKFAVLKIWQHWVELYFAHMTLDLRELWYAWAITQAKSEHLLQWQLSTGIFKTYLYHVYEQVALLFCRWQ